MIKKFLFKPLFSLVGRLRKHILPHTCCSGQYPDMTEKIVGWDGKDKEEIYGPCHEKTRFLPTGMQKQRCRSAMHSNCTAD